MSAFAITLPAVRDVQAGREYYLSAIPLRHVPQIMGAASDPTRDSGQATNKKRVRELVRYILGNPAKYTLPPLVACIDGRMEFHPASEPGVNVGTVRIGMEARISVNDGGDSIAAIAAVVAANPKLGDDTTSFVLIPDAGLKRSKQVFADLARNSVRNSSSLTVLYDQRSEAARLAKAVMRAVPFFTELTETKKSSISNRSTKLFTLSAIHSALQTLLAGLDDDLKEKSKLAAEFWTEVGSRIPAWQLAKEHKVATADLRRDFIHAHGLALAAIARAGNQLLGDFRRNWKAKLKKLSTLDWSRANTAQWEGRAMNAGRLSKRNVNVVLTGNLIKRHLGLELSPEEQTLEREFRNSRNQALEPRN
jgi:DNA sulfur modification protein DndB